MGRVLKQYLSEGATTVGLNYLESKNPIIAAETCHPADGRRLNSLRKWRKPGKLKWFGCLFGSCHIKTQKKKDECRGRKGSHLSVWSAGSCRGFKSETVELTCGKKKKAEKKSGIRNFVLIQESGLKQKNKKLVVNFQSTAFQF